VEGSGVGVARARNLANKAGRLQYFEKVWEMTREDYLTKSYGPDKKARLKRLMLDALNCEVDATFCWGENVVVNSGGKPRPESEGLIHRIATADSDAGTAVWSTTTDLVTGTGTSRVWNLDGQNQWTLEYFKKFMVQAGEYVSDKRLLALHGKFFLPRMESLFNGQVTYMPNDFKNLGFSVHSFESNGVVLDFVHWTPLDDAGMVRDCVTVDVSNISIPYFEDIWHEDLNPNGAQIVYGHFLAKMGLQVSNVLTHSLLTGMPSS
jgi:hypothetical protein